MSKFIQIHFFYPFTFPLLTKQKRKKKLKSSLSSNFSTPPIKRTLSDNSTYINIVARDWRGAMVFANVKKANTNIPVQAEVEAMHWTILLTSHLNIQNVRVKSDSEICIDAVKAPKQ